MFQVAHVKDGQRWTEHVNHQVRMLPASPEQGELSRYLLGKVGRDVAPERCAIVQGARLLIGGEAGSGLRAHAPSFVISDVLDERSIEAVILLKVGDWIGRSPAGCAAGRHLGESIDLVCLADGCGLTVDTSGAELIYLAPRAYLENAAMWNDPDVDDHLIGMVSGIWPWMPELVEALPRWTTVPLEEVADLLESLGTSRAREAAATITSATRQLEWDQFEDPTRDWED